MFTLKGLTYVLVSRYLYFYHQQCCSYWWVPDMRSTQRNLKSIFCLNYTIAITPPWCGLHLPSWSGQVLCCIPSTTWYVHCTCTSSVLFAINDLVRTCTSFKLYYIATMTCMYYVHVI